MTTHSMRHQVVRSPLVGLTLLVLALVALVAILFVYTLPEETGPPEAFELAREVDLAVRTFSAEPVLAFTLAEANVVGIYYALQNVETTALELSLVPDDGQHWVLLRSQGLRTDRQGGGLWEQELPAGTYQLLLSADQGQGTLSVYWGYP